MKKWLALLFPLAAWAQPQDSIVIGSWNIEWLGAPQMRSGPSRDVAQKAEDLAQVIQGSGVDVLALEEISDNPATEFDPDNPVVARALEILSQGQTRPWKYILFPKKDEGPDQLTGIAWNSARVSAIDGPYRLPIQDKTSDKFELWKRWPQAMQFRTAAGMTDFVVIPIHLKSNRKDLKFDSPARQRAQESAALVKVLAQVRKRFQDQDVIVLGDTNCLNARERALKNLVHVGYRDLNAKDMRTTWKGPAPFDRIFLPLGQPEFKQSKETVYKPSGMSFEEFKIRCSDHYLVTAPIRVLNDDD